MKQSGSPGGSMNRAFRLMRQHYQIYLFLLPTLAYFLIFHYGTMYGAQIAFKDYNTGLGMLASPWVGFKHFARFITREQFHNVVINTVRISLTGLILGFPFPILLALLLNELRSARYKKVIQTVTYAPHFISTVVVAAMITLFLSPEAGFVNRLIALFGGTPVYFMIKPEYFTMIYVISDIWQGMGWGSIIYIAALASVDPALHESAVIDGASRYQRILHINIPCILPTIVVMLILRTGSIMHVGFEKVFLLSNDSLLEKSEVISTYTYRVGIRGGQMSLSSAIGLFNSVVNFVILVLVNWVSRRLGETSLW